MCAKWFYQKKRGKEKEEKGKRKQKRKGGAGSRWGCAAGKGPGKNEKALGFSGDFTPFRTGEPYIYSRTLTAERGHFVVCEYNYAVQRAPLTLSAAYDARRVMFMPAAVFSEDCLYMHRSFPAVFPTAIPGGITSLSFAVTT